MWTLLMDFPVQLNVSCCCIGTMTNADNGNNSFHQMVIFWPHGFTRVPLSFLRTLAMLTKI